MKMITWTILASLYLLAMYLLFVSYRLLARNERLLDERNALAKERDTLQAEVEKQDHVITALMRTFEAYEATGGQHPMGHMALDPTSQMN